MSLRDVSKFNSHALQILVLLGFVICLTFPTNSRAEQALKTKVTTTKAAKVQANVAKPTTKTSKTPAPTAPQGQSRGLSSVSDSNNALEVRGQSRNLSMMLVLKNRRNNIDFVKPRETYSKEIKDTSY